MCFRRSPLHWFFLPAAALLISCSPAPQQAQEPSGAAMNTALPGDVYPDSRNRLPLVRREELDEQGQRAYDAATADTRSLAGLQGPAGLRLHSPSSRDSSYLRYETDLGRRLSELAILVAAREMDQQFEWTVHEAEALKQGLEPEIIDVVRHRQPLTGLGEKETVIIQLGREVFGNHQLSSETFARALQLFGKKTLVDLVSLMGNYAATAALLTTFDQQLPPDLEPLLPIP